MSRQLEQYQEQREAKRRKAILIAVEGGLGDALSHAGCVLLGFSVKLSGEDCLMTLRVLLAGREQISFVGGTDLGSCLIKCSRLARTDKLTFRDSKF